MATFHKKEARKGPKLYEVIIGAFLSLILGVLLGVVYLIFQPVEEVDALPPEDAREARTVYFVEGATGMSGQYNWRPKQGALLNGVPGTLQFIEEELNQWAATDFEWDEPEDGGFFVIAPQSLNFRIYDGKLQIASELITAVFGFEKSLITQAHGGFIQRNGRYVYIPESLYVGGMKVPHEGLAEAMVDRVLEMLEVPEELSEAWGRLSNVEIEANTLILEIP